MMYKFNEHEFDIIANAIADGLEAVTEYRYEQKQVYVDKETSDIVDMPTKEDVESGKVILSVDPDQTLRGLKVLYDAKKLTPAMMEAGRIIAEKKGGI